MSQAQAGQVERERDTERDIGGVPTTITDLGYVTVDPSTAAKAKSARLRHSNYFITINTNIPFSEFQADEFETERKKLGAIWMNVLQHIPQYVTFLEPGSWNAQTVKKFEAPFMAASFRNS